jgi:hypothetical protein
MKWGFPQIRHAANVGTKNGNVKTAPISAAAKVVTRPAPRHHPKTSVERKKSSAKTKQAITGIQ